jgi:ABC-type Na+ efflux pump permease subunit
MQYRDFWALLLTILSAPFFILIYFLMTGGGTTTYDIQYQFADTANDLNIKNQLVAGLKAVKYADGKSVLNISEAKDTASVKELIRNRKVDLFLFIPSGFADSLRKGNTPDFIVFGEASNPKYSIATIFTLTGIE